MMRRTAVAGTAVATLLALAMAGPAYAFWSVQSSNDANGYAAAGSLPTPTGSAAFAAVTGQATFSFPLVNTAVKPTGYTVKNPSGTTICTLTLASPGAAGSCPAVTPVNGTYTAQGTLGTAWLSATQSINVILPTVVVTPPASPTSTSPLTFGLTFSEPVAGLATSGISLSGTTAAGATVQSVSGSGQNWTVTVSGMTGSGTVSVAVNANAARATSTIVNRPNQQSAAASVTYNAPVVAHTWVIAAPPAGTNTVAGTSFNVTVQARIGASVDSTFNGTRTVTVTGTASPSGQVPTGGGSITFVNGVATVPVTLYRAGANQGYTLNIGGIGGGSTDAGTASSTMDVTAAGPVFTITASSVAAISTNCNLQNTCTTTGLPSFPTVSGSVADSYGNPIAGLTLTKTGDGTLTGNAASFSYTGGNGQWAGTINMVLGGNTVGSMTLTK